MRLCYYTLLPDNNIQEFLAIGCAISLNETFVLFCYNRHIQQIHIDPAVYAPLQPSPYIIIVFVLNAYNNPTSF